MPMATSSVITGLFTIIILSAPSHGYKAPETFQEAYDGSCDTNCRNHHQETWTCRYVWRSSWAGHYCYCGECTRVCSLESDAKVSPSACAAAQQEIPGAKDTTLQQIGSAAVDAMIAAGTIENPFAGAVLGLITTMFDIVEGDDPLEAMKEDINHRFDAMMNCFSEMIAVSEAEAQINIMKMAMYYYHLAWETDKSKIEEKARNEFDAWREFGAVIAAHFTDEKTEPKFYQTLLMSTQNFAALYSILSVDWLGYLKKPIHVGQCGGWCAEDVDYEKRVRDTLVNLQTLIDWTKRAKKVIKKSFTDKLDQIACNNGDAIAASLSQWESDFDQMQTAPIEKLYDSLKTMSGAADSLAELDYNYSDTDTLESEGKSCECKLLEVVFFVDNFECSPQAKKLGTSFANVRECAVAAINDAECPIGALMWSPQHGGGWGCGCCSACCIYGSGIRWNEDWAIYKYHPDPASADGVELLSLAGSDVAETDAFKAKGDICAHDAIVSNGAMQIEVLEVEGRYFFFDPAQLDEDIARKGELMMVRNDRTESMVTVMVWKDGHGRMHPRKSAQSGDWMVGDILSVVGDDCADGLRCLPKNERDDTGSPMSMICQATGRKGGRARLLGA